MITCDNCGEEVSRYVVKFNNGRRIQSCHVCEHPRHSLIGATNPYADLVLEHCIDEETGKPVRVTSKRQLLAAEKKYKFKSLVANYNSENFDKPPQEKLSKLDPLDRIAQQLDEQVGRRDSSGNKLGFLHPEIAKQQLRDLRDRGMSIDDW